MDTHEKIEAAFTNPELILAAVREGAIWAAREHKAHGIPMTNWQDGKVVWVQPDDIPEFETANSPSADSSQ